MITSCRANKRILSHLHASSINNKHGKQYAHPSAWSRQVHKRTNWLQHVMFSHGFVWTAFHKLFSRSRHHVNDISGVKRQLFTNNTNVTINILLFTMHESMSVKIKCSFDAGDRVKFREIFFVSALTTSSLTTRWLSYADWTRWFSMKT